DCAVQLQDDSDSNEHALPVDVRDVERTAVPRGKLGVEFDHRRAACSSCHEIVRSRPRLKPTDGVQPIARSLWSSRPCPFAGLYFEESMPALKPTCRFFSGRVCVNAVARSRMLMKPSRS